MKPLVTYLAAGKLYVFVTGAIALFISGYSDFISTLYGFLIITTLDTLTSIHAGAKEKGLKFNPLKWYFWREIKSGLLREWAKKVFVEYFVYVIIAFVLEVFVIQARLNIQVVNWTLDLPTSCLWIFMAIELWSIGENIEDAGGVNWIKRGARALEKLLPAWITSILKKK